jgi:hypothetical protein
MVKPYLPGWTFVDLGPSGGPYDESAHPKGCVHTTEGSSLAGAETAYWDYPPHLGYDPKSRTKHQYVRLDLYSYAFKGSESDDEFIVQIETVGFAADTHNWPDEWYRNFGEDVIAPLREVFGIPDEYLRFYRQDEDIVLATPSSPIRLSDSEFRSFSGWLGHQHVPAPDSHWDPGGFLMDKALEYSRDSGGFLMGLNQNEQEQVRDQVAYMTSGKGGGWPAGQGFLDSWSSVMARLESIETKVDQLLTPPATN